MVGSRAVARHADATVTEPLRISQQDGHVAGLWHFVVGIGRAVVVTGGLVVEQVPGLDVQRAAEASRVISPSQSALKKSVT